MGSRLCSAADIPPDSAIPCHASTLWFRGQPSARLLTNPNLPSPRILITSTRDFLPADGNGRVHHGQVAFRLRLETRRDAIRRVPQS